MDIRVRWEHLEGEKKFSIERERDENEIWFRVEDIYRNRNLMDRGAIEICRAPNLDRYEFVEVLWRIYWWQKCLDGSRFCQGFIGQTETFSMDWEAVEKLSRQIPESLINLDRVKICRERKFERCKTASAQYHSFIVKWWEEYRPQGLVTYFWQIPKLC